MSFWQEYSHAEIMSMHGVEIDDTEYMDYEIDVDVEQEDDNDQQEQDEEEE